MSRADPQRRRGGLCRGQAWARSPRRSGPA